MQGLPACACLSAPIESKLVCASLQTPADAVDGAPEHRCSVIVAAFMLRLSSVRAAAVFGACCACDWKCYCHYSFSTVLLNSHEGLREGAQRPSRCVTKAFS
jgi:hypothetical protein